MVGGRTPSRMAMITKAASTAPEAPSRWPVMDLVDEMGISYACSPNTVLIAAVSLLSFNGVEVPCALIYPISIVSNPASSRASFMAMAAPAHFQQVRKYDVRRPSFHNHLIPQGYSPRAPVRVGEIPKSGRRNPRPSKSHLAPCQTGARRIADPRYAWR